MNGHEASLEVCGKHSGLTNKVGRNERDITVLFKSVDTIKTWIIVGACTVIINLLAYIAQFIIFNNLK